MAGRRVYVKNAVWVCLEAGFVLSSFFFFFLPNSKESYFESNLFYFLSSKPFLKPPMIFGHISQGELLQCWKHKLYFKKILNWCNTILFFKNVFVNFKDDIMTMQLWTNNWHVSEQICKISWCKPIMALLVKKIYSQKVEMKMLYKPYFNELT